VSPLRARLLATAALLGRFGAVGLVALVVDIGTFNLCRHVLELGPLASKTIAVALATTVAFCGNRGWAFADRAQRGRALSYAAFVSVNLVALGIGLLCLSTSAALGFTSPLAENISGNVIAIGLGTAFRFWAYDAWVFPRAEDAAPAAVHVLEPAGPVEATRPVGLSA
jgi:putative flippase GtrA